MKIFQLVFMKQHFFAKNEVLIFYVSLLGVFGESLERNQREMLEKPTIKFKNLKFKNSLMYKKKTEIYPLKYKLKNSQKNPLLKYLGS